jgi:ATP-binding cassette subfamily F protein uup
VIEVVTEVAEEVDYNVKGERISAASLLEYFLFPRSTHSKRVESLSGGEKRRLHLLKVLMTNPNFLILDEPTNDLDLVTLRRLEDFLHGFEGCLVVVSHDRYFMDRSVDHLFVFEGEGKIKDYPGSYSQYQTWKAGQVKLTETEKKEAPKASLPEEKSSEKTKTKLSFKEKREFQSLEKEIEALEAKKAELAKLLHSGESDYTKLSEWTTLLEKTISELEEKSDRWLELATLFD